MFVIFGALLTSALLIAPAQAGPVDEAIGGFLAGLILQVASLFVGIMAFFVSLLLNVASYSDFINFPGVLVGWTLVRDIANMFFVVVLLIIAFGTILGHEQYHYKKLLPRFVGAAVLINFSRLITGLIIDVAQVIMMTFVNAIQQVGGGNFIQAFQINNAWKVAQDGASVGGLEQIITAMFVMVLMFVAAVLVGMFALLLVLRTVTLWVLIVLSPLAALLYVVPVGDFKKYYDEWWGKFKANVFLGPVIAFFLWLALTMSGDGTGLYAKIKEKGNADFGEADTVVKKGITGSAISSIENLSSFVIAAAIFAIAFDIAKKMSAQAGMPGAGAITKAAGGLIKGGVSGLTGYSAAGRALAPAWKQMKEIRSKTALGTGIGKKLERGVLVAGAATIGGAAGAEAKDRLMTARWDDTQKKQQKLKRQTNESLSDVALTKGGAEGRAAALELSSRGHRFKPEEAERVLKNMEGDERGLDQLKQNMRKNMPELAYNLNNETERNSMVDDPSVTLENLGPRAFTDAEGRVTDVGRATFETILRKRGTKGTTNLVEKVKDRGTREAMLSIMQERIPTAVVESAGNKTRLEATKTQLAADQVELTRLERGGLQTAPVKQRMQTLRTNISDGQKTKNDLELRLNEGSAMVEAHVKETGRPDEALKGVTDPVVRQREMAAVLKKVKLSDLKDDALKNPAVIAGMQGAFGGQLGDAVKGMNPDKREILIGAMTAMNVQTAPPEAVEARIRITGNLEGVDPAIAKKAVETMNGQQLGTLDMSSATSGITWAILDGLVKNEAALRAAPANREANAMTLRRIKRAVLNSTDAQYQALRDAINVPGKSNKWNDVDVTV